METKTIISLLIDLVFGGTSIVAIIKWLSGRKKRKAETKGMDIDNANKQVAVDDLEFETLKKLLEYQDERVKSYEDKMKERDRLDDEMRNEMINIKRCKYELEATVLRLKHQLSVKEEEYNRDACLVKNCQMRQKQTQL